jgi:cobalt-zinc-cadmium efflux system membrane fusion protein
MDRKKILITIGCGNIVLMMCILFFNIKTPSCKTDPDIENHQNILLKTSMSDESAEKVGISLEKADKAIINQKLRLIGSITLNHNKNANIRARFPGIVKEVKVNLGDKVLKDQVLAIVESNESLRMYDIVSPLDGSVLMRNTNIGDVANEETLFTVADLTTVWARFHVFSEDTLKVKKDQFVDVDTVDDLMSATGKINILFPIADALTQTHIVIVEIENSEGVWKPGMKVIGDVNIASKEVAVAVNEKALQRFKDDQYIVFVKKGLEYEARPVQLGIKGDGYIEIIDGLAPGEEYVSDGSQIIKSDILKSTIKHGN